MYRDDYIMRMINRLGQIILYISGLRQQGQYPMALMVCDDSMRNALGIGSDAVAGRSEGEIIALIRFADRDGTWRELATYVAAILHAEAAIYEAQGQPEVAVPRALLALQILVEADLAPPPEARMSYRPGQPDLRFADEEPAAPGDEPTDGEPDPPTVAPLPDYAPPRAHLLELLAGYELPARTVVALMQLYERDGDYAAAENVLFDRLSADPADAELRATGAALFGRLLTLDDDALERGGLSRPEVEGALAELRAA